MQYSNKTKKYGGLMKKKCAIVTGGTKNHFPAMATLVLNIKDKCPNLADDIIIFHDGVPAKQQKILNKVCPVKFIQYETPFDESIKFSVNYFTNMVFCKYECWNLLKEYKTVIWLDYDMLVLDNLLELLDDQNNCVAKFCPSDFLGAKIDRLIYRKPYFAEFDKKYVLNRGGGHACTQECLYCMTVFLIMRLFIKNVLNIQKNIQI